MAKITLFDKSKLPSRHGTVGPERAPHRSYYYAMGLAKDDIARPFVGVVTTLERGRALQHRPRPAGAGGQARRRQAPAARRASSPPSPSPTASPWATRG